MIPDDTHPVLDGYRRCTREEFWGYIRAARFNIVSSAQIYARKPLVLYSQFETPERAPIGRCITLDAIGDHCQYGLAKGRKCASSAAS